MPVKSVNKSVQLHLKRFVMQVTSSFLGIMLGPTLGIFTLAMMFPWANAKVSFNVINSGEARQVDIVLASN